MMYKLLHSTHQTTLLALFLLLYASGVLAQLDRDEPPSPDDLFQARALVNQCLGTDLSVDSNRASLSGNRMVTGFRAHESEPGQERFYVARFLRDDTVADWQLQTVQLHSVLTFGANQPGVHVSGVIDTDKARLLHESVAALWTAAIGPDFQVITINSTHRPDSDCELTSQIRTPDAVFHDVFIMGEKRPQRPVLPPFLFTTARIVEDISDDLRPSPNGEYKFNFREDDAGYPTFISVECVSRPDTCNGTLATLRTAIGVSDDAADPERQREAILASLPSPYADEHIDEIQTSTGNGQENLVAQLKEVAVSPARTVRAVVICHRPLGSGADFDCEYRFISYIQTLVNGKTVNVRTLAIDEAQVEAMTTAVANEITNAMMINIADSEAGIVLNAAGPGMPIFTALYDRSLNLTKTEYRDR